MVRKYTICFVVCVIVYNVKAADETPIKGYPITELPCLMAGGTCVKNDNCPKNNRAMMKGLCPVQQDNGLECCYGLPKSATRCRDQGGECFPSSYQCSTKTRATDCADEEKCLRRSSQCIAHGGYCLAIQDRCLMTATASDCAYDQKCCILF